MAATALWGTVGGLCYAYAVKALVRTGDPELGASEALELRDYGRLDLKLTPSGQFVFLEANPNPAVVPPRKSFSGSWGGMAFDNVVTEITLRAWRRRER